MWQRMNCHDEMGSYAEYIHIPDNDFLWRRFINDETKKRTIFREADQIKLI